MIPLGSNLPTFSLIDTASQKIINVPGEDPYEATLIMFICNHCPFVVHIRQELIKIAKDYTGKGLRMIAISSNDIDNYPEDSPQKMAELAKKEGFLFPYLYDESQDVAKMFSAACTPDFFLYDSKLKLVYRGQLDDSRPGNGLPVTGKDLRTAINATISGGQVNPKQHPSIGCNIKWK
ncbi:MAG: thioredoxin family protein [SAR324 cluster bacterium]|uniref:Thioredoxin family protein n=1 Tax=SAR324 cluster bacterium TaxID=2024889 RepID=A0A7X9FSG9_9DELT|nr:thioredoxin family protein [SAR324 cluster bacterium]